MNPKDIAKLINEDVRLPQHLVEQGLFDEPADPDVDMGPDAGPDMDMEPGMEPDMGPEEQAMAEPITMDRELLLMLLKYAKTGEKPEDEMGDMGMGDEMGGDEMDMGGGGGEGIVDGIGESIAAEMAEEDDSEFGGDEGGEEEGGDAGEFGGEGGEEGGEEGDEELERLVDAVLQHSQVEGDPEIPGEAGEGKIMTPEDFDEIMMLMDAEGMGGEEEGMPFDDEGGEEGPPEEFGPESEGAYESRRRIMKPVSG